MSFGIYSIVLLVGMVQGLVFAVLLLLRRQNRVGNALLASLLLLFVITVTPSMIGFAGAYQRYPWLTFAPFTVMLGFGPMMWLYVTRLLRGRLPRLWGLHVVPLAIEVAYYSAIFVQPLEWRSEFNVGVHLPVVEPIETGAGLISACVYWIAACRLYRRYCAWVPEQVSDSENYNLAWLRNFLIGTAIGFIVWAGFEFVDEVVRPLSYPAFFWLDLLAAALLYGFAVAGYRHADLSWPAMTASSEETSRASDERPPTRSTEPGEVADDNSEFDSIEHWDTQASEFREAVESSRAYLDPDLSLDSLARKLCTNTWTLSRAINEGAGCNFNDFINAFRVRAVQACLADQSETRTVLEIALACGFNSKTSFNRSFKKLTGETPTQCRTRLQSRAES